MSHLGVHGVPGHAVDSPGVAAEHGDGLVPLDVEDVHLVVFRARGHKGLVHAPETAVNHVKALKCQNGLIGCRVICQYVMFTVQGLSYFAT